MDVDTITRDIVCESICTAVCIDNAFVEPYTPIGDMEDPNFKIPKNLYDSFKKHNCLMDIYNYEDFETWEKNRERILKNKDLLILDWELTKGDPPFKDALEILNQAIQTDSLPFIYVYTQEIDLDKIILNLYSYFHEDTYDELKRRYGLLCDSLEDIPEVEDANELLKKIEGICKELILHPEKSRDVRKELFEYFKKEIESDKINILYERFFEIGKEIFKTENRYTILRDIGLFLFNGYFRDEPCHFYIFPIEGEKYTFLIHNTLIKLSTKKLDTTEGASTNIVSSEDVYSEFSKTIWKKPRNFLTLMGLEMKNFYRDGSANIGKDLSEIDEMAFFYHEILLESIDSERFHDFLKQLWVEEVASYLIEKDPKIFSALEEYKTRYDINNKLTSYDQSKLVNSLATLNYYYSIIRKSSKISRKIRFGDILSIQLGTEIGHTGFELGSTDQNNILNDYPYILCITPRCDCLRPDKIDNNLFFVFGREIRLTKGLEIGDSGFISFIVKDKKPICIEWKTTPYSIHIPIESNNITNPIEVTYSGKRVILNYLCQQKENYTQRIANESFRKASRVGIDFAKLN